MKKLLLFIFALFLWTGAWAQNLSLGKYVHLLANGESGVTELSLQGLTNGNTTEDVQLATYDEGTSTLSPIQAFYIDLGAVKELSKVEIYWEGALCTDYSIKGSTTTGDSENPTWDIDYGTYNVARGTKHKKTHDAPNNFSTRYIKFEPANNGSTEGYSNPNWTVKMREFQVFGTEIQILSGLEFDQNIKKAGTSQSFIAKPLDQNGNEITSGSFTYSISPSAGVTFSQNGNTLTITASQGVYTITATDGENNITAPIGLASTPDDPSIDSDKAFVIYSEALGYGQAGSDASVGYRDPHSSSWSMYNWGENRNSIVFRQVGAFGISRPGLSATNMADIVSLEFDMFSTKAVDDAQLEIEDCYNSGHVPGLTFDVVAGWHHYSIPIDPAKTNFSPAKWLFFYLADPKDENIDILIDNIYYSKEAEVDKTKPVMSNVTVASTNHKSATLTVNATDNNTTGTLTYKVKNSSNEVVATGSAVQGGDATVVISGLTASTDYSAGDFKVTATDHAGNESDAMNVPAFSTAAAPTGQSYTNGTHEILVQPRHYTGTFDYELIITSEEAMTGFTDGCYWKLNGSQNGTQMKKADIVITDEGKTMTVRVRSSVAPVMDTPLYILMPGEVSFKEANESNPQFDWVGIASGKTYDVLVNDDKAAVVGTISASNLSDFQTAVGNTSVIDISGAAIDESIDKLTTNNANAIFQYADAASASAATKTTNSVYYFNVRFYGAPNGLTFVDNPASVPLLPEKAYCNIADGKKVVINREIAAGKYVTTYMGSNAGGGMEATLETGLEAYELAKAEAGQLTFTKVNSIAAGKGYVIHNTTSGALTLTWQTNAAQVYLDNEVPNQNPDDVEAINGVKILGTLHTITTTTDGNQWLLSDNQIKKGNGAKISPYRAYFTGVTLPSGDSKASAVFVDGETTKIGSIDANGEINVMDGAVYNLAGQRVAHPTKGLYIVNGKKVIIK